MKKRKKNPHLHDLFFKDIYSKRKYAMDLFNLILSEEEMEPFDWSTLRLQVNTFVDKTWTEKRTDLIFFVNFKNSSKKVGLLFLLEHKSYETIDALLQLLNYQTGLYNIWPDTAIVPILIYQGKKEWKGALAWQDRLKDFSDKELRRLFGKNVINFRPKMLNIQDLDIKNEAKGLTTRSILYILQKIWGISDEIIANLFKMCQDLPLSEKEVLIQKAVTYINQYDSRFSLKVIAEIEKKTIKEKEDRTMEKLKSVMEIAKEEGLAEGVEKGMQAGRAEGIQTGRAEGIQTGIEKGRQQVILSMLQKKLSVDMISTMTDFSEEEIKKLQNGN